MMDPWLDQLTNINTNTNCILSNNINDTEFEDNFVISLNVNIECDNSNKRIEYKPLPDSTEYLLRLERKLEKLKSGSKLIDALSDKREDCLRSFLQNTETFSGDSLLELDNNLQKHSDSVIQNFQRFIQPIQPSTLGETVEFIKYDQLQQQHFINDSSLEIEETLEV